MKAGVVKIGDDVKVTTVDVAKVAMNGDVKASADVHVAADDGVTVAKVGDVKAGDGAKVTTDGNVKAPLPPQSPNNHSRISLRVGGSPGQIYNLHVPDLDSLMSTNGRMRACDDEGSGEGTGDLVPAP